MHLFHRCLAAVMAVCTAVHASQLRGVDAGSDPGCKSWCSSSTKSWEKLCKKSNCEACSECDTTTTISGYSGCKSWCATSTKTWEKLCQKSNCQECSECDTTTTISGYSGCKSWCETSTKSWKKLCKKDNCAGCAECTPTTAPPTTTSTTTAATTTTTTTTNTISLCASADLGLADMSSRSAMEAAGWSMTTDPVNDAFDGGYKGWYPREPHGAISATMQGRGTIAFTLSNPHDYAVADNYVWAYQNGVLLATVGQGSSTTLEISFSPGDVIKIEEGFAIIEITDFEITGCEATTTTTTTTIPSCPIDMGLEDMRSRGTMEAAGWSMTTDPVNDAFDGGYKGWYPREPHGAISATMQGQGTMAFTLSNPHVYSGADNYVWAYKNGVLLATVGQSSSTPLEISFSPGDVIKIEEGFAIIDIKDFGIECS